MKVVILSIVLLLLVIAGVVFNAIYSGIILDTLSELVESAYQSSTSDEVLLEAYEYWESHKDYLCLTASLEDIDSITENLLNFKTAATHGNAQLFDQSYSLLLNAIDDIRRFEKLSLCNIL